MNVTIKDVAKKAKVSVATVSRVINNIQQEKVGAATRAKVLEIIEQLGFKPNLAARSLSKQITSHIGLFLPFSKGLFMDNYYTMLLQGIMSEINTRKYSLTLFDSNLLAEDYSVPLQEKQVDGLLIVSPPNEQLKKLLPYASQTVLLSATYSTMGFSSVDCDNFSGARKAGEYITGLGHKAVGLISGPSDSINSIDRVKGFSAALKNHGVQLSKDMLISGEFVYSKGVFAARKLLSSSPRPTAIFCCNDTMAFAVMQVAAEMGISVPKELSVMGFDDVEMAAETQPKLTTVKQPIDDIGRMGVRQLFKQIDSKAFEPENIMLPVELVTRESCRQAAAI